MGKKTEVTVTKSLETEVGAVETAVAFTKTQLLKCARYSNRKDALSVLLKDNERYTYEEVERMLKKFMNKRVK